MSPPAPSEHGTDAIPLAETPAIPAEAYDALADLFLGDDQGGGAPVDTTIKPDTSAAAGPVQARRTRASVQGLILGHLPVLPSAWVTQYARQFALSSGGPVAVLRVRGGEVSLDLISGQGDPALGQFEEPGDTPDLRAGVALAAPVARSWVLLVESSAEPSLAALPGLDALTLITGTDEAAIVSGYQSLKRLLPAGAGNDAPAVQIAMMGAPAQKAAESAERIARAAGAFLGRRITVSAVISKVSPARIVTIFRGPLTHQGPPGEFLERALRMIRTASAAAPAAPTVHPLGPAAPVQPAPHTAPVQSASGGRFAEPVRVAQARPAPLAPIPTGPPTSHLPASTPPAAPQTSERPVQASAAPSYPQGAPDSLARHIPGLETLGFVCPYAPEIELALDEAGAMHLLSRADGASRTPEPLAAMMTVATWAMQHERLIALAAAGLNRRLDDRSPLSQHLFTPDARRVRALLDTPVRLHLLAPVTVEGRQGWFCTPLN
jgi:hypothetical protein